MKKNIECFLVEKPLLIMAAELSYHTVALTPGFVNSSVFEREMG